MVLHKYGNQLYEGLRSTVLEHLQEVANQVASAVDEEFLSELNKAWSDHKISMLMIRDILMYMVLCCPNLFLNINRIEFTSHTTTFQLCMIWDCYSSETMSSVLRESKIDC